MRMIKREVLETRFLSRLRREERGVSAVLVGVALIAMFGAAVLSIDAGSLWATRRNIVTATDASALGQARSYALNPPSGLTNGSCPDSLWSTILANNINDTSATQCTLQNVGSGGNVGVVIVSGQARSPARFSGALGIGDSSAFSQSAAMWGYVPQPTGLRPISFCTFDPHVQDALLLNGTTSETHVSGNPSGDYWAPDNSEDYAELHGHGPASAPLAGSPAHPVGVVHHISFTSSCNGAPGNFGWIDLNEYGDTHSPPLDCQGACSNQNNSDLATWLMNGYYGNNVDLTTGDCDTQDPNTPVQQCGGDTGAKNSNTINNAMDYLVNPTNPGGCTMGSGSNCNPLSVPIVLYNTATAQGSGANFNIVGVAFIRIWNYQLNNANRFLDIEFTDGLLQGVCCSSTPPNNQAPPPKGEKICDVDHDPADPSSVAARCTFS